MDAYDFENSVGFLVNNTAKSFQKILDMELRKKVGVTIGQWRVVVALVRENGLTQTEIAEKVGIEGATLVPLIDKMEHEGLLKRKPDLRDRRVNRIYLTSKADSLWKSMMACALNIRRISTKGISENELQDTMQTLRKISGNLAEYLPLDAVVALQKKTGGD
ncbi:MAG: MarR family transcriptional regulator [Thaumarchaeota archaeon]|nr:MarR family transcriptional regulator [Nitrososphaerota archaeon]